MSEITPALSTIPACLRMKTFIPWENTMSQAQTADAAPLRHPAGLWVLIFTETWERFSHYGMRALLILYLTTPLAMGGLGLDKPRAAALFGGYMLSIYLFSLNGGQIADRFLGAKRTIVLGGLLIAAGQLLLQVKTLNGLVASLVLIAIGTCMLKPNISASVGRLYGKDDPRRDGAFTIEYMGINTGATIAPIICGFMAENAKFIGFLHRVGLDSANGWSWAFGVSGAGMLLGLLNFVLRRKLIVDASLPEGVTEPKPKGIGFVVLMLAVLLGMAWVVVGAHQWYIQLLLGAIGAGAIMTISQMLVNRGIVATRSTAALSAGGAPEVHHLTKQDRDRLLVVGMMLLFSISFWGVFQQAGSTLSLFAKEYTNRVLFGFEIPASWFQTVNAILIVGLGPLFVWLWAKRAGKFPSSPQKFALALFFAAAGFLLLVPAAKLARPTPADPITQVSMGWLMGVYVLHTFGELCLSPVGLSYVSKLAPKHLTSQLMGAWFFALGIGAYLAGKAAGFMDSVPLYQVFLLAACVALGMALLLYFVVSRIIFKLMGGHS
jgi:POT family proton-dependent oligopeptide transporter